MKPRHWVWLGFFSAGVWLWSGSAYSIDCTSPERMIFGACIECQVGWNTVSELLSHPPMFWDICLNEKQKHPLIHYFPTRITPRIEKNKRLVHLRKNPAGEWVLNASLMSQPDGRQGVGSLDKLFQSLQMRYPAVQFVSPPPDSVEITWLGKWPLWIESSSFEAPTGLEPERKMRLYTVFRKEFGIQVQEALKRPLGMLARIHFKYSGYDQHGKSLTLVLPVALVIGDVKDED